MSAHIKFFLRMEAFSRESRREFRADAMRSPDNDISYDVTPARPISPNFLAVFRDRYCHAVVSNNAVNSAATFRATGVQWRGEKARTSWMHLHSEPNMNICSPPPHREYNVLLSSSSLRFCSLFASTLRPWKHTRSREHWRKYVSVCVDTFTRSRTH